MRGEGRLVFGDLDNVHILLDVIREGSHFCLDPSWSLSDLV